MAHPNSGEGRENAGVLGTQPLHDVRMVVQPSTSNIVTLRIAFEAGSADDPSGQEGVALLTATLMAEGGAGDVSYAERERRLFPMAGELGTEVSRDEVVFVGRVHKDRLAEFYPLFLDVLAHPQFTDTDFQRVLAQQKSALTQELRGNDDEELGKEELQAVLYASAAYGHPELGTESALSAITVANVRAFRDASLCAGRATVGLAGALPEGFADQVKSDVAALGAGTCSERAVVPTPPAATPRIVLVDKPDAASTAVSMGFPIDLTRASPDYPAMVLAAAYFGQHRQFVGRLMQKMRNDRGLNYGDYAYTEAFVQDGWSTFPAPNVARRHQYFSIWLRPVPVAKEHFAIRMAVRELRDFVEHGMSDADFQRVRGYVSSFYALYLQTESRRLGFALDDSFYGMDRAWLDRLRDAWAHMSVADVNAAVRRTLGAGPAALQIIAVTSDAAALRDALAAETPSPITYDATPAQSVLDEDRDIVGYHIGIPAERITIVPVAETFR